MECLTAHSSADSYEKLSPSNTFSVEFFSKEGQADQLVFNKIVG